MVRPACPQCGYSDLVRAHVRTCGGIFTRKGARCVTCGHRFRVARMEYEQLRVAEIGEPYGTSSDLDFSIHHLPMTSIQVFTTTIAGIVGLAVGCWAAMAWDNSLLGLLFVPILYSGWWVGRILSRPTRRVPGRCRKCQYSLRGLAGGKCPECGTKFEACDTRRASPEGSAACRSGDHRHYRGE